jgi:hypothetical protein
MGEKKQKFQRADIDVVRSSSSAWPRSSERGPPVQKVQRALSTNQGRMRERESQMIYPRHRSIEEEGKDENYAGMQRLDVQSGTRE